MNKKDVYDHFGGSPGNIAGTLDVSTQYVSQWSAVIPESMAGRLDKLTDGALKYNPQIYIEINRQRRTKK